MLGNWVFSSGLQNIDPDPLPDPTRRSPGPEAAYHNQERLTVSILLQEAESYLTMLTVSFGILPVDLLPAL